MDGLKEPNGWHGTFVKEQDPYALMRNCSASSRLIAQHYLWKDLLGFLVHPSIPTQGVGLKIADVATGNGIWLHDLARDSHMSVELHGFDISLDQVDPPSQFWGYFDIVHVRLITVVIKNNDPRPVLEKLTKLLKPGGYLQWDEVDTISCSIKTVTGVSADNLDKLFSQLKGCDTWKYQLTQMMNESGYTQPSMYVYEYSLGMARFWNDVYVSTWKEFAENILQTSETSHELEGKGMEEARNGAAIMVPKLVWVARNNQSI
ncbi:hypothetical protein GQ53DRAFT_781410 [Thozetella sp. PMI_491]|nr:hypothetical protein GQ53DRAFT_781410 [Thozetella sp. PMI_491]